MNFKHTLLTGLFAVATTTAAFSADSAIDAAKLKTELTPLGAERAGNKDGSIPAWSGGMSTPPPGWVSGGRRADPFKDEKPLFSISAQNLAQYESKLNEGTKALFKRYPDSYRIDVYPTHRTAAAPQWVYDNTAKNAVSGRIEGGLPVDVKGGIPFPIASTGEQVMWNHLLRWRGTAAHFNMDSVQVTSDGRRIVTTEGVVDTEFPYYFQDALPAPKGDYVRLRMINAGPPIRAGEAILGQEKIDPNKTESWVYLTGQRRVRKLPNACCDSPTPATAGLMSFDEVGVFIGRMDRFDWKLIGKQEMYIPYNSNRTLVPNSLSDVMASKHLNPDHVRWELHRVWIVEATLRAGQRHLAPRSRYYVDEDSWIAVMADRWDANGQLWRTLWSLPFAMPDLPGVTQGASGFYDLVGGGYFANDVMTAKKEQIKVVPRFKDGFFTPEALAGEGVR